MNARCCGIAGTYGLKAEKYDIAMAVGADCSSRSRRRAPATVACDSETCRWQITHGTGRTSVHPIDYLHRAYGLYDVVGIVVVSHSETLAEGVVELAREMGGEELALEAAGGTQEPGVARHRRRARARGDRAGDVRRRRARADGPRQRADERRVRDRAARATPRSACC